MSHVPLTERGDEVNQSNLFKRSLDVGGNLTYDPVIEIVPAVRRRVGWCRNRHYERYTVKTPCLGNPRMTVLTFGEVGPRGRDGDPDRQRTTIGFVRRSEGADDESADGKD